VGFFDPLQLPFKGRDEANKIFINPYKGQAGDLNIRYHSEQANCPERKTKRRCMQ